MLDVILCRDWHHQGRDYTCSRPAPHKLLTCPHQGDVSWAH